MIGSPFDNQKLMALAQSDKILSLRNELPDLPICEVANKVTKLDTMTREALNLAKNLHGNFLVHSLIHNFLYFSVNIHDTYTTPDEEGGLIEALKALEVDRFNIYDLSKSFIPNTLFAATYYFANTKMNDHDVGRLIVTHVASKVSDIDRMDTQDIKTVAPNDIVANVGHATPLMRAVYAGDLELTRILIKHGASPDFKNENGLDCHRIARDNQNTYPEFYREFLAMTLVDRQQDNAAVKKVRRL